jgi:hypothetical protein
MPQSCRFRLRRHADRSFSWPSSYCIRHSRKLSQFLSMAVGTNRSGLSPICDEMHKNLDIARCHREIVDKSLSVAKQKDLYLRTRVSNGRVAMRANSRAHKAYFGAKKQINAHRVCAPSHFRKKASVSCPTANSRLFREKLRVSRLALSAFLEGCNLARIMLIAQMSGNENSACPCVH